MSETWKSQSSLFVLMLGMEKSRFAPWRDRIPEVLSRMRVKLLEQGTTQLLAV
jgi:hypothetical protein